MPKRERCEEKNFGGRRGELTGDNKPGGEDDMEWAGATNQDKGTSAMKVEASKL